MNKYSFIALIFIYLLLSSFMISSLGIAGSTVERIEGFTPTRSVSSIMSFFSAMGSIMTFSVTGIPIIFNAIFFYWVPPVIIFMVIDVVKDIVPFT